MALMTADEFVAYAHDVLFGEATEPLFEQISQYEGEVAMFGDAGPGAGLQLRQSIEEYDKIARRYEKLTGELVPPIVVRWA